MDQLRGRFDRLFDELSGRTARWDVADDSEPQSIPVNIFETENEIVVVAPTPGIEANNIDIRVEDDYLTIQTEKRGPGQERHRYLRREWSYGPYERTVELPTEVDVERANASYGNGIMTIALPKATARRQRKIEIQLDQMGTARGEHVGHRGTAEAGPGTDTGPKGTK